ncbi:hypothetical protein RJ639_037642 [Escallonia herrerae]|uniref:Uncharacterized protein n=1 Tax=Escallonia herrerae TaxID=1293975 RepID=A0AA88WP91_9ASTE|nr:hypothetical protein RJ639_037642 [Escallonia herrerae]
MFLTRVFGRTLLAAAKTETSGAAAAAASAARTGYNPLEEFFEADRNPDEDKPVVYVSLENYLHLDHIAYNIRIQVAVSKSMCRIKHVLTERAIEDLDPRRSAEMRRMINAL